jgi:hypothetical protein
LRALRLVSPARAQRHARQSPANAAASRQPQRGDGQWVHLAVQAGSFERNDGKAGRKRQPVGEIAGQDDVVAGVARHVDQPRGRVHVKGRLA